MKTTRRFTALTLVLVLLFSIAVVCAVYLFTTGLSARPQPTGFETVVSRTARNWAIRSRAGTASNPIAVSDEVLAEGRAHFADHCSVCHANDGGGNTEMGRGLFPKSPTCGCRRPRT